MPVYNEADILPFSVRYLLDQEIEVHVLEGWSTDGSWELLTGCAREDSRISVERFPADGPSGEQCCRAILHRIENLAAESGADWCMLNDADEWRSSSVPGETLAKGIARVDFLGWNAIDHNVRVFLPVDNGWAGQDPRQYFRHYTTDSKMDMLCGIPQVKIWENGGRVDLASTGGHDVRFAGRRVNPRKFLLSHYPFRNSEQARRKLHTRLDRRCYQEHRDGWGVHYDVFPEGFDFLWKREQLTESV